MVKIDVKVTGIEETNASIMKYHDSLATKFKPIVMSHTKSVVASYKSKTPVGPTGNLKKSVSQRLVTRTKKTTFVSGTARSVFARATKRARGNHRHLVGYGSRERFTKSGASRGKMPANTNFASVDRKVDNGGFEADVMKIVEEEVKI